MSLVGNLSRVYRRFLSFLGVGAMGTLMHYTVLYVLMNHLGTGSIAASVTGSIAGATFNYGCNYRLTFRSTSPHLQAGVRYLVLSLISIMANSLLMSLLVIVMQSNVWVAQVLTTAVVVLLNYLLAANWVFRTA